jgi:hypothetical protein
VLHFIVVQNNYRVTEIPIIYTCRGLKKPKRGIADMQWTECAVYIIIDYIIIVTSV